MEGKGTANLPDVCRLRDLGEILEPVCGDSKLQMAEQYADHAIRAALAALATLPVAPAARPRALELFEVLQAVEQQFKRFGDSFPDGFDCRIFRWVKDAIAGGPADTARPTADAVVAAHAMTTPHVEQQPSPSAGEPATWRSLLDFVTHRDTEDAMVFLRAWQHGEFDVCRREWPEAPESVYPEMPAQPAVRTPTGSAT